MCVSLALSLPAAPGIFDMADYRLAIQLCMGNKAVRTIQKHPAPYPWIIHALSLLFKRTKNGLHTKSVFCVGVTYLPGPSPDKYFRRR